jgi:hypothetical protein
MKSILKTSRTDKPGMGYLKVPGLILMFMFLAQITFAQTTLVWKGTVSSDALNSANWEPQMDIAGNILQIDSAYKYTNAPVISGSDSITINNLLLDKTGILTIDLDDSLDVIYISTETPNLFGTININRGTLLVRRCEIDDSNTVVTVKTGGILETNKYLFFGNGSSPAFGGFLNIEGKGLVRHTASNLPGRFPSDTTQGIITIVDDGVLDVKSNWVAGAEAAVAKGQLTSTPDRDIVIKYNAETNWTHIYSRDKMAFLIEPVASQKVAVNESGNLLYVIQNDGWASMTSFDWKYTTTSGSGYVSFSPVQTNDSITPVFTNSGSFYVVCVGNNGTTDVTSNEVFFVVSSDKVSISPAGKQKLRVGQMGAMLTVTETETASSREWKYSTTSGKDFVSFPTAQTGTEYTPDFADPGVYYVNCQSVIGGVTHTSNEVEIEVVATDAAAYDMKWVGDVSSDAHELVNWFPISHIEGNNLIIDTPYVHAPVISAAGNDHIGTLDVRIGASLTIDKPATDTLFRGSDFYLWGHLIVNSGVFRINGRLRLEDDSVKVTVTGGKILMTVDFIVGTSNGAEGADFINMSGNGIIDAGAQIWRWANSREKSVFTITDNARLLIHSDARSVIYARMDSTQIRTVPEDTLIVVYPYIVGEDTMTMVYARPLAAFGIAPPDQQILGVNEEAAELSTVNSDDKVGFEWKYSTTSGSGYASFDPVQTESTCTPSFDAAGTYYVICEGYSLIDTAISANEVEIVVVSVAISPTDMQTITHNIEGTTLTVAESVAADSREWKFSMTSGSGYTSLPIPQTGTSVTPLLPPIIPAGIYYVVCESNFGTKSIISNEVTIRLVTNSIAPTDDQLIAPTNEGTPLTVTESIEADSRAWKYTLTPGENYEAAPGDPTGLSWAPVFDSEGTYYVVCVSTYGALEVISNEVMVDVVEGVSVEDLEADDFMLYPNPATERFFISFAKSGSYTVHLIDMQGRLVLTKEFYNATVPQMITLNQPGIYFVRVITGDSVSVAKIILE